MKTFMRSLMSLALVAAMLSLVVPMMPYAAAQNTQKRGKKPKNYSDAVAKNALAKTGAEVAAYVRKLKEKNKDVREALKAFEKNGRQPKIDDSVMVSGTVSGTAVSKNNGGGGLFHKASFAPQESISGGGYDATFIPSYHQGNEWQGTVVANRYDEYGNHLEQRTHNATAIDWNSDGNWEVIFEVSYQNGDSWLAWEDGMLEDQYYQWGVAFYEQPNTNTYQTEVGPVRESPMLEQQVSRFDMPSYMRASFMPSARNVAFTRASYRAPQAGDRGPAYRYDPRNPNAPRGYIYSPAPPQVRQFARNTAYGCAGAAAACRIAGPWTFSCVGGWCVGAAISQLGGLFQ